MSKIVDALKKWFPMPSLQKRYIIALVLLYGAFKLYVISTPTPSDDQLPDQARDIVIQLLTVNDITGLINEAESSDDLT